jgi:hypothetical protein
MLDAGGSGDHPFAAATVGGLDRKTVTEGA